MYAIHLIALIVFFIGLSLIEASGERAARRKHAASAASGRTDAPVAGDLGGIGVPDDAETPASGAGRNAPSPTRRDASARASRSAAVSR